MRDRRASKWPRPRHVSILVGANGEIPRGFGLLRYCDKQENENPSRVLDGRRPPLLLPFFVGRQVRLTLALYLTHMVYGSNVARFLNRTLRFDWFLVR